MMPNDPFLQTLENHFDTLKNLVLLKLEEAVGLHMETLKRYAAGVHKLHQNH